MNIVLIVATTLIMAGGVSPGISPRVAAPRVPPATPIIHELVREPTYDGAGNIATPGAVPLEDLDQLRHAYTADFALEQERLRVAAAHRQACIDHIDRTFARRGSPLAGYGHVFIEAQERTGVSAALIVGLTAAESSFATDGYLCRTNHNAYGMKWNERVTAGNVDGWCWWPDWTAGVNGAADFIIAWWGQAQTAYDLRGYCEGNPPEWITTVETVRGQVLRGFGGGGSSAE